MLFITTNGGQVFTFQIVGYLISFDLDTYEVLNSRQRFTTRSHMSLLDRPVLENKAQRKPRYGMLGNV
jgi:hypothetical protein